MNSDKVQHQLQFRQATPEDIPFLIDVIIKAESGDNNLISYQKVFDLSDKDLRKFLARILLDDTPHHEFTYLSYYIAFLDARKVGALAGFIEAADDVPSKVIKANLMARAVGIDKWRKSIPIWEKLTALDIERTPGSLQLEYGFVLPDLKARGIMTGIHHFLMVKFKKEHPELEIAECQSTIDNVGLRKLNRIGWVDHHVIKSNDPDILHFTSSNVRLVRRFYYKNFQGF